MYSIGHRCCSFIIWGELCAGGARHLEGMFEVMKAMKTQMENCMTKKRTSSQGIVEASFLTLSVSS
jgi:hypothetical protein